MDLRFDEMIVDTTLAQQYLQNENLPEIFSKSEYFDGTFYSTVKKNENNVHADISLYLKNLAVRLNKNINLFAQLDYLARNIPIEDTHVQIQLIIQQLHYISSCNTDENLVLKITDYAIRMLSDTPVLRLGLIGKRLADFEPGLVILSSEETLSICHLFTKLCYESGITNVQVTITDAKQIFDVYKEECGAVGVISESSDVDSAVDVFLTSSIQVPWSLRRILVQESVCQQFNGSLTWKCNSSKQFGITTPLEHNGRKFLTDSVGNSNPQPTEVAVEAYRTTKELISLLNQYRPHYLSMWANNIAEINELIHSISAQVVWVNSFGDFRGPPRISEAIYSYLPFFYPSSTVVVQKDISELQRAWLKVDIQDRYNILVSALDKIATHQSDHCIYREIKAILRKIDMHSPSSFANAGKDYVCIGVPVPSDGIYLCEEPRTFIVNEALYESVLFGSAFFFKTSNPLVAGLIDALKKAGAPVLAVLPESATLNQGPGDSPSLCYSTHDKHFNRYQVTRVIWTNSGVIFAN